MHLRIQPAADQVFEILRERILSSRLNAGARLTEQIIAKDLGISTTPVREAIQRLVQSGLADRRTARGAAVHTVTAQEVSDVFEMRRILEPLALAGSVPLLSAADLSDLDRTLDAAAEALRDHRLGDLARLNGEFHWRLIARAPNRLMLQTLDGIHDRHRLISVHTWTRANHTGNEWEEHRGIFDAARRGLVDEAAQRLARHIASFMTSALAALTDFVA